jgi:hypothetical protein
MLGIDTEATPQDPGNKAAVCDVYFGSIYIYNYPEVTQPEIV